MEWAENTIEIEGISTEIITTGFDKKKERRHLFVIPGNPGIAAYYKEFGSELLRIDPGLGITVIGYAGFAKNQPTRLYDLQDELDHKILTIQSLSNKLKKGTNIVLVGHSIGAWICLQLLRHFSRPKHTKPLTISKTILLFPFLSRNDSSFQNTISTLLARNSLRSILLIAHKGITKLPSGLFLSAMPLFARYLTRVALGVTQDYFLKSNHILESVFHLAHSEFERLSTPLDLKLLRQNAKRIHAIYAPDDPWAPENQRLLLQTIKGLKTECLEASHDFCVRESAVRLVASRVVQTL